MAGVVLKYVYTCSICGRAEERQWDVPQASEIPRPALPYGWRRVLGPVVCDHHRVVADLRLINQDESEGAEQETVWRQGIQL